MEVTAKAAELMDVADQAMFEAKGLGGMHGAVRSAGRWRRRKAPEGAFLILTTLDGLKFDSKVPVYTPRTHRRWFQMERK